MEGESRLGENFQAQEDFHAEVSKSRASLAREVWQFLGANKKWWLAPIALAIAILGLLVGLSGSAAAPFIYTLF